MEYPSEWPIRIFTVSQLTSRIRDVVARQFRDVVVEGEVSNFKVYPSGHLYFTLKDDSSSLKAVMFNYLGKYPDGFIKDGMKYSADRMKDSEQTIQPPHAKIRRELKTWMDGPPLVKMLEAVGAIAPPDGQGPEGALPPSGHSPLPPHRGR